MRKETVKLSIRSWLCSSQVVSPSELFENSLEIGSINLILGGIVSVRFYQIFWPISQNLVVDINVKHLILFSIFQVFSSCDNYEQFLCVLWSGEKCSHLGVTTELSSEGLELAKQHFLELKEQDVIQTLSTPYPGSGHRFGALSVLALT